VTPGDRALLRDATAHLVVDDPASPELTDDAAHHLFRVLRVREGESVTITDGHGCWRSMRVAGDGLEPTREVRIERERADPVTIGVAIPKRDRPEWIVQKLTELGVARIVFLHADRSVVRWSGERAGRHIAKLRRVAVEALQQSRGVWLPEVAGPVASVSFLPAAVVAEPGGRTPTVSDRVAAIGPEGGWSDDELAVAADRVSLGPTVLRVETAALVLAARIVDHTE
jgi:16S rRNA (uracil1498-N3)-methyltransferase